MPLLCIGLAVCPCPAVCSPGLPCRPHHCPSSTHCARLQLQHQVNPATGATETTITTLSGPVTDFGGFIRLAYIPPTLTSEQLDFYAFIVPQFGFIVPQLDSNTLRLDVDRFVLGKGVKTQGRGDRGAAMTCLPQTCASTGLPHDCAACGAGWLRSCHAEPSHLSHMWPRSADAIPGVERPPFSPLLLLALPHHVDQSPSGGRLSNPVPPGMAAAWPTGSHGRMTGGSGPARSRLGPVPPGLVRRPAPCWCVMLPPWAPLLCHALCVASAMSSVHAFRCHWPGVGAERDPLGCWAVLGAHHHKQQAGCGASRAVLKAVAKRAWN